MAKKNSKHVKSNQTKPQSFKTSVTMAEDKTSATVVEETDIGKKKLLRHQEKIKREEEELKRLQAEKQEKDEAAERSKKISKNKSLKPKNQEKVISVPKMTENISVVKIEDTFELNVEKAAEKPVENPVEFESPTIKTLFVKPGSEQDWIDASDPPNMSEDWNEIIKNEEEPMTDDEKLEQQTGSGSWEIQDNSAEFAFTENQNQWNNADYPNYNDRGGISYRGSDRKNNQDQRSIGHVEFRRGGGGGNFYKNDHPRPRYDSGNRGENSNFAPRYNKSYGRGSRPQSSNESQNFEGNSNTRGRYGNFDRATSNDEGNSRGKGGSRNSDRPNESGNIERNTHTRSYGRGGSQNYKQPASSNESQTYEGGSNRPSYSRGGSRNFDRPSSNETQNLEWKPNHSRSFRNRSDYNRDSNQNQSSRERKNSEESSANASRPNSQNYNRGRQNDYKRDSNHEESSSYSSRPNHNRGRSNYHHRESNQPNEQKNMDEQGNGGRYSNQNRRGNFKNFNRRGSNNQQSYQPQSFGDSNSDASNASQSYQITSWSAEGAQSQELTEKCDQTTDPKNIENTPKGWAENIEAQNDNISNPEVRLFEAQALNDVPSEDIAAKSDYAAAPMVRTSTDAHKRPYKSMDQSRSADDKFTRSGGSNVYSNKNYSKKDSKSTPNKKYDWRSSGDRRLNYLGDYDKTDTEFCYFLDCMAQSKICHKKLSEKIGDLFDAPEQFSLAHCVAVDLAMGAGIAVHFRSKFGRVGDLLDQDQKTGGLAILQDKNRFIYYLITKERSKDKPSNYTLWQSLIKLKEHCVQHDVKNLAIPQIGCGLDRLDWNVVKQMLEHIFRDVDIQIVVYILQQVEESPKKPKKGFVTHTKILLRDIESETGLLYFGTEDAAITNEIESLGQKHNFIHAYKSARKPVGDIVRTIVGKEYIYGLIGRKTIKDKFEFVTLEKSLRELRKMLKKDETTYIGFQVFYDKDSLIVDKILSLMQYLLAEVEIWVCWPPELEEHCPRMK